MSLRPWFEKVVDLPRLRLDVPLQSAQGARFQPTGFPDLGPGTFRQPGETGGERAMLLVESAQSVANRLESVCWNSLANDSAAELRKLPYVRVRLEGESGDVQVTSSLLEAHRLNSPYVRLAMRPGCVTPFSEELRTRAGIPAKGKKKNSSEDEEEEVAGAGVLNLRQIATAIFHYDPNSVLHGVFLTALDGRVRLTRALSGYIEAADVREAVSGGVKLDRVHAAGDTKDGYGNVPYHRVEFVAKSITAYFSLDLALLRSYDLGDNALRLLTLLALWKIRRFLAAGLRLRTACDLELKTEDLTLSNPKGLPLPTEAELAGALAEAIDACRDQWAAEPVTELVYTLGSKNDRRSKS